MSIGRSQSMALISDSPGVGRYQTEKGMEINKGTSMGRSKRISFVSSNQAGVGDYEIRNDLAKGGASMSKAVRFSIGEQLNKPGPGDYHIPSLLAYKTQSLSTTDRH
jgi:hypothetical protein